MKKKRIFFLIFFLLLFVLLVSPYLFLSFELVGSSKIHVRYGEEYQERGASGKFLGTKLVPEIKGTVDTNKLGTYDIFYQVKNRFGIIKKKKRIVHVVDNVPPVLVLNGNSHIEIPIHSTYQDPGYTMIDNHDGDISSKVILEHQIDTSKCGTYEVVYKGADMSGNKVLEKRLVTVSIKPSYKEEYDFIDNKIRGWSTGNKMNGTRPIEGASAKEEELKNYHAYYMGANEKKIYLTFDEGSNATYLKEIVDILNRHQVKATFFLCKNYIRDNPKLIMEIVESGHSIGNHTHNHKTMANYANKKDYETYLKEIQAVEDIYFEIVGKKMDKVYREPRGEWSYRSLKLISDLGYKSFFWSATHRDYLTDVSKDVALKRLLIQKHNGAIYLIHPKNKGNMEAMDEFLKILKKEGYSFGLVRDIE